MIKYGQGAQTVRWVPIDANGVPRRVTSATYRIDDLREPLEGSRRVVVASTGATVSPVDTTLAADAGPETANPKRITLASVTGIQVGGVYMLTDGDAPSDEAVTVVRVNASESGVELSRALPRSFASGDAFQGIELTGTFPADVANDETRLDLGGGPFQVTWSATIGGVLYIERRELWISRYGSAPWVRFDECAKHLPGLDQVVGSAIDPTAAIAAATDDFHEALMSTGAGWERDPTTYRGNISADLYVRKRAIYYMLIGSRSDDSIALADRFAEEARTHVNNLLTGRPGTKTVATHPVNDTATPGGEQKGAGNYFARG